VMAPLRLPPRARRFVRYVVGFGVGAAVGTAPFLGKVHVPGFDAVLALFPRDLRDVLIPLSAFAMGLVAVAVQFQGDEAGTSPRRLGTLFRRTLVGLVSLFVVLVALYSLWVVRVPIGEAGRTVAVVVSWQRLAPPGCPCQTSSDLQCIGELSLNPAAIETCWGSGPLRVVRLVLSLIYLGLTSGFGALIGLLILFSEARRRAAPRPRRRPRAEQSIE
jgi:hypothetical protein